MPDGTRFRKCDRMRMGESKRTRGESVSQAGTRYGAPALAPASAVMITGRDVKYSRAVPGIMQSKRLHLLLSTQYAHIQRRAYATLTELHLGPPHLHTHASTRYGRRTRVGIAFSLTRS